MSNPSVSQANMNIEKMLNNDSKGPNNLNISSSSNRWKTEGLAIIVAGITNVKLFVYDYVEKMIALEEDLDVFGDIGSYLNVMELVKKNSPSKGIEDNKEHYSMFLGTTEGEINIFELQFRINYNNPVLAEFGEDLRQARNEILRKSRLELGFKNRDLDDDGDYDEDDE